MKKILLFSSAITLLVASIASGQRRDTAYIVDAGGITRADRSEKVVHLVFTGHEFADGGEIILRVLKKHGIKASFFFTGDFYRNTQFSTLIASLKNNGHYLGAHSDKHLLYCSWEKRDSLLVTKEIFQNDVLSNYTELKRFGIERSDARYFLPPFEWYNDSISSWTKELDLVLVNFTPGTYSNADWTHPELGSQYLCSDSIYARILRYEASGPDGLNGFLLLTHIGTDKRRKDKFYHRLDGLVTALRSKGYHFTLLSSSIN